MTLPPGQSSCQASSGRVAGQRAGAEPTDPENDEGFLLPILQQSKSHSLSLFLICLSIYLPICLSVCLSICSYVCLSVRQSITLSSIYLSLSLFLIYILKVLFSFITFPFLSLSLSLSLFLEQTLLIHPFPSAFLSYAHTQTLTHT